MKVQDLLDTEDKWGQGAFFRDGRYCVMGALEACYPDCASFEKAYNKVLNEVQKETGHLISIACYNDSPLRTFADVRRIIERANV